MQKPGELLAFAHIRFMVETNVEVLYIYEIQVAASVRRAGLGKHLMQVMELAGFKLGMKKIMLTVLKLNKGAHQFYTEKLKYTADETSPSTEVEDDAPYEILSKSLERGTRAKPAVPTGVSATGSVAALAAAAASGSS